jgi:uncharacterized protein YkwD
MKNESVSMIIAQILTAIIAIVFAGALYQSQVEVKNLNRIIAERKVDPLYEFNRAKASDLLITGYWSHADSDGKTFNQRFSESPLHGEVGEVLGKSYCSLEEVAKAWKASPKHEEIISDKTFTRAIITLDIDEKGVCYWVGTYFKE